MSEFLKNLANLLLVWAIAVCLLASCGRSAYAYGVHQKADELALVGYKSNIGVQRKNVVRNISMRLHFMAELERDTLACVGSLCCLSTNPLQLCRPHLVVNGKAPLNNIGAHVTMPKYFYAANLCGKNKKAVTL